MILFVGKTCVAFCNGASEEESLAAAAAIILYAWQKAVTENCTKLNSLICTNQLRTAIFESYCIIPKQISLKHTVSVKLEARKISVHTKVTSQLI